MKQIIRLTEGELHNMINTAVKRVLREMKITEDGGMVGGAAANASGFMNGASNDHMLTNAQYDVPLGSVQRKKGYSPKGKSTSTVSNVDMSGALKRHDGKGGSISIPKERK